MRWCSKPCVQHRLLSTLPKTALVREYYGRLPVLVTRSVQSSLVPVNGIVCDMYRSMVNSFVQYLTERVSSTTGNDRWCLLFDSTPYGRTFNLDGFEKALPYAAHVTLGDFVNRGIRVDDGLQRHAKPDSCHLQERAEATIVLNQQARPSNARTLDGYLVSRNAHILSFSSVAMHRQGHLARRSLS